MKFIIAPLMFSVSVLAHAQNKMSHEDSLLIGTWKGTSICQIRPSACNDEINVYHVSKSNKPNVYHIVANKIVNEQEENMGEDDYNFDIVKKTLNCVNEKYKITVNLTVKDDKMEGTLASSLDPKIIYRVIKLNKTSSK